MRDPGLNEAIRAAGGVSELARQIGISQPSVSNWTRVPAERVIAVEAATGVDRDVLRPDLYGEGQLGEVDEVDAARAQEYALIAALLLRAPDAKLLANLAALRGDASPLGLAHAALAEAAAAATAESVEREYFDLFIGLGRGELLPYASYYLTGFLQERPLARLRDDLAGDRHRPRRRRGGAGRSCRHPVRDHGRACRRPAAGAAGFRPHDLRAPSAALDRPFLCRSGKCRGGGFLPAPRRVGRVFMEIETEAFDLPV